MAWVTRQHPHVDRCATAWLIRRFIDPKATFRFIAPGAAVPAGAEPFDLPGARYGHHGADSTFETTIKLHSLGGDRALSRIAALVHDLDFRKGRLPEAGLLDAFLAGLQFTERDDHAIVEASGRFFEALYAYEQARLEAAA